MNVPPNIFADFCGMKATTTNANIHLISFLKSSMIAGKKTSDPVQRLEENETESLLKLKDGKGQACLQTSIASKHCQSGSGDHEPQALNVVKRRRKHS